MKRGSKILIFFTLLGLSISLAVAINRARVESNFKEVDLAIDYEAVNLLARQFGLHRVELLKRFKAEGATSVIVKEDTIMNLAEEGELFVFSLNQLKEGAYLDAFTGSYGLHPKLSETSLRPDRTYILTEDPSLYNHLYRILNLKMPGSINQMRVGGIRLIEIQGAGDPILEMGIGFFSERLLELSSLGFEIILFPSNPGEVNPCFIDYLFRDVGQISGVKKVVFEDEVLGYPQHLAATLKGLEDMGLGLIVLEFTSPKGINAFTRIPDRVIRSHRISDEELNELNKDAALDRMLRAVRERNIRCLYLLPFLKGEGNPVSLNLEYLCQLRERLTAAGFKIGTSNRLVKTRISNLLLFLVSLGVISFSLLLVNWILPLSSKWSLSIFILGAGISISGLLNHIFLQQFWAIIAGILFPALAILTLKIDRMPRPLVGSLIICIKNTLLVTAISFAGALFVIGLLSESEYLLKIVDVRGVKATLFLPILAVGISSCLRDHSLNQLLTKPIRTIHLIELGILTFLFILFLVRSGNYGFGLLPGEEGIRRVLEGLLSARPRFKEFLIGYPALLLAIYLLGKGYKSVFLLILATLSQVSLVNAYLHLHTPLLFQLIRSINGLVLGTIIGLVVLIGWCTLTRVRTGEG